MHELPDALRSSHASLRQHRRMQPAPGFRPL